MRKLRFINSESKVAMLDCNYNVTIYPVSIVIAIYQYYITMLYAFKYYKIAAKFFIQYTRNFITTNLVTIG